MVRDASASRARRRSAVTCERFSCSFDSSGVSISTSGPCTKTLGPGARVRDALARAPRRRRGTTQPGRGIVTAPPEPRISTLKRQTPIGCQTVFSSRNAEISYRLCESGAPSDDPLDVVGRGALEVGAEAVGAGEVDRVDVHVRGEPRRELGAVAGEQVDDAAGKVARREHLGELDRGERARLRGDRDDGVAADERRRDPRDEAEQRRLLRRDDGDDAGRLGHGEVEVRARRRGSTTPSTCASLSAKPAYQTQRSIARSTSSRPGRELGELGGARLHHLGDPVEHLAAVVRGRRRPLRLRGARGDDGVAGVLARGPRDVLALRLVGAPRLGARERAADEELVGLLDGQAGHAARIRPRRSPCRTSAHEVERHEDVVDVVAVEEELALAGRPRRRSRPTRRAAARPRSAEHPQRQPPRAARRASATAASISARPTPAPLPAPGRPRSR